jgi:transcriptional regulator with XRE-family HTH domain
MTSQAHSGPGLSDGVPAKRYPLRSVTPSNPLRYLRKRLGFTQEGLADAADVSRIFVVRAEQGVYEEPSATLIDAMRFHHKKYQPAFDWEFSTDVAITRQYEQFQLHTRRKHYGQLLANFDFLAFSPSLHPFLIWREASEVNAAISISKYYCVHPAIIHKFEKQTHLMHSVPEVLRRALLDAGYTESFLDELEWAYTKHRRWKASKVSFTPVGHSPSGAVK